MSSRVICVARVNGGGGEGVGAAVAEALGFTLIDEEILQRAAEKEGIAVDDLNEMERRSSALGRLLHLIAMSGVDSGLATTAMPYPEWRHYDPKSLRGLIRTAIEETADQGNVVIVSHAASYALATRDDTLRVLVTAPTEVRIARVEQERAVDTKQATKVIADDDAGRASYLKQFYGVGQELPTHYDMVLNSQALPVGTIADLVVSAARAR